MDENNVSGDMAPNKMGAMIARSPRQLLCHMGSWGAGDATKANTHHVVHALVEATGCNVNGNNHNYYNGHDSNNQIDDEWQHQPPPDGYNCSKPNILVKRAEVTGISGLRRLRSTHKAQPRPSFKVGASFVLKGHMTPKEVARLKAATAGPLNVRPADDPQDMLVRNTRNMTISDDNKENSVVGRGRVSMSCG